MYKLAHYGNDESGEEFVVIVSDGDVEGFERNGYKLITVLDIDGDAGSMPTDRELTA